MSQYETPNGGYDPSDHAPASRSFRTYDLASLGALNLPDLEYVVDGLIPTGSLSLLAGREKAGKSLLTLDMAASVAAGEPFLGRDTIAGPVILGAAEDHPRSIRSRLQTRIGPDLAADPRPVLVLLLGGVRLEAERDPERLSLTDPIGIAQLTATIEETGAVLCILDCLRELHDEEENDSIMGAVVGPLRRIAHETGSAIVVVHHASKGGGHRGSTAIAAACDSLLEWIADDEEATGPVRGKLTAKGRDVPRLTIHAELGDGLRFVPTEAPATAPNARGRILEALQRQALSTAQEIAAETGIPVNTVKNVLTVLARDTPPTIERTGTGRRDLPYRYAVASRLRPAGIQRDVTGMDASARPSDLNHPDASPRETGRDDSNIVSLNDVVALAGPATFLRSACVSCGGVLEPGQRVRCAACVAAAYREAGR